MRVPLTALVALLVAAPGASAGLVTVNDTTLQFDADGGESNAVTISCPSAQECIVTDSVPLRAIANSSDCGPITPNSYRCTSTGFTGVAARLLDGNDTLTQDRGGAAIRMVVVGGDDSDTINGGGAADALAGGRGADTLNGFGGDDSMEGQSEADRIDGGEGSDLMIGGCGRDRLYGRPGNDTITGETSTNFDSISVCRGAGGGRFGEPDILLGGAGDDYLIDQYGLRPPITRSNLKYMNRIKGESGFDTLRGVGEMTGGNQRDRINGTGLIYVNRDLFADSVTCGEGSRVAADARDRVTGSCAEARRRRR